MSDAPWRPGGQYPYFYRGHRPLDLLSCGAVSQADDACALAARLLLDLAEAHGGAVLGGQRGRFEDALGFVGVGEVTKTAARVSRCNPTPGGHETSRPRPA